VTCITCGHAELRDALDAERDKYLKRMVVLGLICCGRSDYRASFHGPSHTCSAWSAAPDNIAGARLRWMASKET
jgi:hypothetical protein